MKSDDLQEEPSPLAKLFDAIEKVVIYEGKIPSDPKIWEIHIGDKILRIDAENLISPHIFQKKYLKEFHSPAPRLRNDQWDMFIGLIGGDAEIVPANEESEYVYYANRIMGEISQLPETEDKEEAVSRQILLKHEGCLCLVSSKIEEIVRENGFKIAPNRLSSTMTDLGYKAQGTKTIRCEGRRPSFWWFDPSKIAEFRGDSE